MATISSLTNGGPLQDNDKIPIARVSGGTYVNNAILGADLKSIVPAGVILYFALQAAPSGWMECNGAALSTAAGSMYDALRTLIINDGNRFGVVGSDPKVPDLRGRFIRSFGTDSTVTPNIVSGVFGAKQASSGGSFSVTATPYGGCGGGGGNIIITDYLAFNGVTLGDAVSTTVTTGNANSAPANVALLACIKL